MKLFDKALNELSIPKNFKNIHSVTDLLEIKKFGNDINTFFEKYLNEWYDSFKMNMDEVLNYIPESELKKYKFAPGYEFIFCDIIYYVISDKLINDFLRSNKNLKHYNNNIYIGGNNVYENDIITNLNFINNKDKIYLVDTKNKIINVCLNDLSKINVLKKSTYGSSFINYSTNNYFNNNFYNNDYKIILESIIPELNIVRKFTLQIKNYFNLDTNEYQSRIDDFLTIDINIEYLLKFFSKQIVINEENFKDYA